MSDFAESYLGKLRAIVGSVPLIVCGVRVVVEDKAGRILLQLRGDFDGVWGLPGGNMEFGETLISAVVREVLEETGLTVDAPKMFGFSSDPKTEMVVFPNGDVCHFHVALFHCSSFGGELTVDQDETRDLRWSTVEDFLKLKSLANMHATANAFLAYKRTGKFELLS
jgi:ADP-ribose pyrophosphatase YjhB (NUDIX family)